MASGQQEHEESEVRGEVLPVAEVRAELDRIIATPAFARSERLRSFLTYIVEETLQGHQDNLKEYQVGISVCRRSENYDPRTDPVVRVEARRLRSALESYYATEGREDLVVISLPKGGYVPSFEQRQAAAPVERERKRVSVKRPMVAIAGVVMLAFSVSVVILLTHRRPVLTDKDTVVVADFVNTTGDPVFDDALRQGLSTQLGQSPFLNLLPDARVSQNLALMARNKDEHLTAELARQVCERTGSAATIEGSISTLGGEYVLNLKAVNCHEDTVLAQEQVTASGKEQVLSALATAASGLRRKLGESLATVEKFDAPPENVTTPSLEALQAYSLGFKVHVNSLDEARAAELFRRAVSIDPRFAMAYARLATCYTNLGESSRAMESTLRAYELRDRVSEHERLFITSQYQKYVSGDLEAARKTYELRAEIYGRDDIPIGNLGNVFFSLGMYNKAVEATQEALRRNPGSRIWHGNLVGAYVAANQLDKARSTIQETEENKLQSSWLDLWSYLLDYLQHDTAAMDRDAAKLKNQPGFEDALLYYQSQAAANAGKLAESRELSRRATELAQRANQLDSASLYLAQEGLQEALIGSRTRAIQQAHAALALSQSRDTEAVAAVALAVAGNTKEAERMAEALLARLPDDTLVRSRYVPMIRAAAALYGGDSHGGGARAIELLAATAPYESGSNALARVAFLTYYPAYFRGEAYLATGQAQLAVNEFKKVVDNKQLTMTDPVSAIARLSLAQAYELSGDLSKAASAQGELQALWINADAGLPLHTHLAHSYFSHGN